jgi:hypothetical protein
MSTSKPKLTLVSSNTVPENFRYQVFVFKNNAIEVWRNENDRRFLFSKDGWKEEDTKRYGKTLLECISISDYFSYSKLPTLIQNALLDSNTEQKIFDRRSSFKRRLDSIVSRIKSFLS